MYAEWRACLQYVCCTTHVLSKYTLNDARVFSQDFCWISHKYLTKILRQWVTRVFDRNVSSMRYTCLRASQQQIHHKFTKHAHQVTVKSGLTLDSSHRVVISRRTCAFSPMSWCNLCACVEPSGSSFPTTCTVSTVSSGCSSPAVVVFVTVATGAVPASESASVDNVAVLVAVANYKPTWNSANCVLLRDQAGGKERQWNGGYGITAFALLSTCL
jgi:hypothetical protein